MSSRYHQIRVGILMLALVSRETFSFVANEPEQIHISLTETLDTIVTWSTASATERSVVRFGLSADALTFEADGTATKFVDGGAAKRSQFVHRVRLDGLMEKIDYYYACGDGTTWSGVFKFRTLQHDEQWSPRFAVFGDLGFDNAKSVGYLMEDVDGGIYDLMLHVGDFAYNMDNDDGKVGDKFMNLIQPLAARLPYMVAVGNHEDAYNFSHYKNRFSMPGSENGMFYSFNVGPAHIIAFSTEFYYYLNYGTRQVKRQYEWLQRDLREANLPENRAKRPWIITMGHRPMYCTNADWDDCTLERDIVRVGFPLIHTYGLEKLFFDAGVDLEIWAHEHSYERLWPIFNVTVYNGSYDRPYENPRAPVHITSGSAGCIGEHDPFLPHKKAWSAFRSIDYGYSRMQILNGTHLLFQQVSTDQQGKIIDEIMVIRDSHGPFGSSPRRSRRIGP